MNLEQLQEQFERDTGTKEPLFHEFGDVTTYETELREYYQSLSEWLADRVPVWISVDEIDPKDGDEFWAECVDEYYERHCKYVMWFAGGFIDAGGNGMIVERVYPLPPLPSKEN